MRLQTLPIPLALVLASAACALGPEPKDASTPSSVPIYNTAAVVSNIHTITDVTPSHQVLALLAEPGRDPRDVRLDQRYQAAELLTFLGVHEGERVGQLGAGGGYFTELLARDVGPSGRVFAVEPPSLLANTNVASAFDARLDHAAGASIVRVDRELASPLPADARDLDLVYEAIPYRSLVASGTDAAKMDAAAFAALKPGGRFVVLDYRPRMSGPSPVNLHALHAEESASVRRQVEAAGFHFLTEGRFLRDDPRPYEWDAIAAPDPTALEVQDRFLLEFQKP